MKLKLDALESNNWAVDKNFKFFLSQDIANTIHEKCVTLHSSFNKTLSELKVSVSEVEDNFDISATEADGALIKEAIKDTVSEIPSIMSRVKKKLGALV